MDKKIFFLVLVALLALIALILGSHSITVLEYAVNIAYLIIFVGVLVAMIAKMWIFKDDSPRYKILTILALIGIHELFSAMTTLEKNQLLSMFTHGATATLAFVLMMQIYNDNGKNICDVIQKI